MRLTRKFGISLFAMMVTLFIFSTVVFADVPVKSIGRDFKVSQSNNSLQLSWKKINSAVRYDVYCMDVDAREGGSIMSGRKVGSTSKLNYQISDKTWKCNFVSGHRYYLKVCAVNSKGNVCNVYSGFYKKVNSTKFNPSFTYSLNKTTMEITAYLKWKRVPAADGYRIQWVEGDVSNFKNASKVHTVWVGKKSLTKAISGLRRDKVYSFRIQTQGKVEGLSSYSAALYLSQKL